MSISPGKMAGDQLLPKRDRRPTLVKFTKQRHRDRVSASADRILTATMEPDGTAISKLTVKNLRGLNGIHYRRVARP